MKNMAIWMSIFALGGISPVYGATPEERGLEIAKKSDAAQEGFKGESSIMKMVLINDHGDRVERKMESKVREVDSDGDMSITEFNWPADVKGTKMLTHTHKKGDDDQWLYLPSVKRTKRISSSNKSGSFMGSEFAFEDLGSQEVEKFNYKYLRDETLEGRKTWVLERFPLTDSGYTKQVLWMDQEYLLPVKIEYYDRKKELLKTANFGQFKKFGKFWRANEIKMVNVQTGKQSIITWDKRELNKTFPEREFQSVNLKK